MATISERIGKNGAVTYRAQVRRKGQPTQSGTFKRKTDAKKWATEIEAQINKGVYLSPASQQKKTFGDLFDFYVENILPTKGSGAQDQYKQLLFWNEQFKSMWLGSIQPEQIYKARSLLEKRKTKAGKTISPATQNRYRAVLSHAFNVAVKQLNWLKASPVDQVRALKEPAGRTRYLSGEEKRRLLEACKKSRSQWLYPVVMLALMTGMRRREIEYLMWKNIDFEQAHIRLLKTKNSKPRTIPISKSTMSLLMNLRSAFPDNDYWVFPSRTTDGPCDVRHAWETAKRNADISDFRFHDLRHTVGTDLAKEGANVADIADLLGHSSLAMAQRYIHIQNDHRRMTVEKLALGMGDDETDI